MSGRMVSSLYGVWKIIVSNFKIALTYLIGYKTNFHIYYEKCVWKKLTEIKGKRQKCTLRIDYETLSIIMKKLNSLSICKQIIR